jgi:flagellar hook-associated protein 1 FlgK
MHLSELTGATAVNRDNGTVDVYVGGSPLVNNLSVRQMAVGGSTTLAGQAADPPSLNWADTGLSAGISSGSLASSLETMNTTLPKYTAAVDQVAATLAQAVNDQHATGFDLAGNAGAEFFTGNNGGPVTASTIKMAITDTDLIAASVTGGDLNGDNADAMAGITSRANGPDTQYRQLIVDLGTAAQAIDRRASVQSTMTTDLDAARQSDSGVNLDEEMTNLMQYQRAYEAASKVINAIDSMLDTIINRMGN